MSVKEWVNGFQILSQKEKETSGFCPQFLGEVEKALGVGLSLRSKDPDHRIVKAYMMLLHDMADSQEVKRQQAA